MEHPNDGHEHDHLEQTDDELERWFNDEIAWIDLSAAARLTIALTGDLSSRIDVDADPDVESRIVDERETDRLGPWARIPLMIDHLSGERGEWVSPSELALALLEEHHVRGWLDHIAEVAHTSPEKVLEHAITVWTGLDLEGTAEFDSELVIETTFDGTVVLWRSHRRPWMTPDDDVIDLATHICRTHEGNPVGSVAGRIQIELPFCELFVGRIADPDIPFTERLDRPLTFSALCGVALESDAPVQSLLTKFLSDPTTPTDLTTKVEAGVGVQVWLDRAVDDVEWAARGSQAIIEEFLHAALDLVELLEPFEARA